MKIYTTFCLNGWLPRLSTIVSMLLSFVLRQCYYPLSSGLLCSSYTPDLICESIVCVGHHYLVRLKDPWPLFRDNSACLAIVIKALSELKTQVKQTDHLFTILVPHVCRLWCQHLDTIPHAPNCCGQWVTIHYTY